jgi:YhcH/YjgK/YiaL family protein
MITDTLDNAGLYAPLHPLFADAFGALRDDQLNALPPGEYELQGRSLYAVVALGQGKSESEAPLETHRRYVDIHCLLGGEESIGWKASADCTHVRAPYDEGRDIAFWEDPPSHWIRMRPGMFALFFPGDAHAPMVSPGTVRKIILKVALSTAGKA